MTWESTFELVGFAGSIVAVFYLFKDGKRAFTSNAVIALKIVLLVSLLKYGLNASEWSGFFNNLNLDYAEDYLDDIWPFAWFLFFFTAMLDISAQKTHQSEKRYRVLFNSTMDSILVFDQKGYLVNFNEPSVHLTEYDHKELRNLKVSDIFSDIDPSIFDMSYKGKNIPECKKETLLTKKDGSKIPVELKGQMVTLEDRNVMLTVARDISEKRRREAEMIKIEKLEALGVMAGGIAHDFNNFLMGMMGNISLLKINSDLSDKTYKQLEGMEKAAIRAKDLTQQLLTFARGGKPVKTLSDLGELIQETINFVLKGSNVKPEFKIDSKLYPAEIDKGQVAQVISNLVINADQAMPDGGVILIEACNKEIGEGHQLKISSGFYVKITIQDSGIGIPEEYLNKIFDPYFSTKEKGSGLGLAVAISVIEKHYGKITVSTETGKGTKFCLYLPASKQRLPETGPINNHPVQKKGNILVMDDERIVRETLSTMLEMIGFEVKTTQNGEEAITAYQRALENKRAYDIVILDLTVPGAMGGEETIGKLLEIDPGVKAIVSSGYYSDPVMSRYKDYGFQGVLQKPYLLNEMKNTINALFDPESA